jgi:effector-binding domain-containing protein
MLETPQIVETSAFPIAFIPMTVSWQEMPKVMGPGIAELLAEITSQGAKPVGEIFTHHLRRPTDTFEFEISVPVDRPIKAEGRVQPGEYPATRMARTVYQGPYEGLADAWPEFFDWIEKNGHTTTEEMWESYTVGPHSNPNPSTWRTELSRRLAD